jgi:hypothetical protein
MDREMLIQPNRFSFVGGPIIESAQPNDSLFLIHMPDPVPAAMAN